MAARIAARTIRDRMAGEAARRLGDRPELVGRAPGHEHGRHGSPPARRTRPAQRVHAAGRPDGGARGVLVSEPVRLARLATGPFTDRLVAKFRLPVTGWRGPAHEDEPGA